MGDTNQQRKTSQGGPSLTGWAPEIERRPIRRQHGSRTPDNASQMLGGFRAVGAASSPLAALIIGKHGGGILANLKAQWAAIVGTDCAAVTWPTAFGRDGVLKLRTASGAALDLQHRAPLLIERINLFFGRPVIARLALVQGPLPLSPPPSRRHLRPLTPGEARALDEGLAGIADPELRAALTRLGQAVIGEL